MRELFGLEMKLRKFYRLDPIREPETPFSSSGLVCKFYAGLFDLIHGLPCTPTRVAARKASRQSRRTQRWAAWVSTTRSQRCHYALQLFERASASLRQPFNHAVQLAISLKGRPRARRE